MVYVLHNYVNFTHLSFTKSIQIIKKLCKYFKKMYVNDSLNKRSVKVNILILLDFFLLWLYFANHN